MGLFYKYKCKKCGKRYFELPTTCDNCGTELSFVCPLSRWLINPDYKKSKDCEEIHEFAFAFWKSEKTRKFEEKINGLNVLLSSKQEEIDELIKRGTELGNELREVSSERWALKDMNRTLSAENLRLKQRIEFYETTERLEVKTSIPQDTIEAVKYAMKKSHPDNGGNAEDFKKFRDVYEELTRK